MDSVLQKSRGISNVISSIKLETQIENQNENIGMVEEETLVSTFYPNPIKKVCSFLAAIFFLSSERFFSAVFSHCLHIDITPPEYTIHFGVFVPMTLKETSGSVIVILATF